MVGGKIALNGVDLASLDEEAWRRLRGDRVAMIFQDPMMTLNPVLRIDTQMVEAVLAHHDISRDAALDRCRAALAGRHRRPRRAPAQLPAPVFRRHAPARGHRHRTAQCADLIIADEPTTALDVTIQGQILFEMQTLCRETGAGLIWITHDLSVISGLADEVCVMYAGRIVESGSVDDVLEHPMHPYTRGLLESIPGRNAPGRPLAQIPGMTPSLLNLGAACAFRERCTRAIDDCRDAPASRSPAAGRTVRCVNPVA
jgi:peptide/nickel transport system ATP-binding protein